MNKEIKNIWQAISEIQAELPVIDKTAKNSFLRSNYTPLDDVVKRVYPLLAERSVACSQILEPTDDPDCVQVKTVLCHWPSDTSVESVCRMPVDVPISEKTGKPTINKQQGHGSTISYARRYALTSILGIVCGDEDDDGGPPHQSNQQQPAQDNTKKELAEFATWLKDTVGCTGKDDLTALLAWLASTGELTDVTNKQAVTSVQHSRMLKRALERVCSGDGINYECVMENARDFYMKTYEQADVAV